MENFFGLMNPPICPHCGNKMYNVPEHAKDCRKKVGLKD